MLNNKAILWDFDGTLSYPNRSFSTALYTAISEAGYRMDADRTVDFLNTAYSWKTPDEIYPHKTGEDWWETMYAKTGRFCRENGIKEADISGINTRFRENLTDVGNYRVYDDAVQTLQKCLGLGYKNYLASNNYPEIIENLQKLGIATYLSGWVVSSHIGYEKPRVEFYDYAKRLSGNPEMLYMIGDNPIADIWGGKNSGLITIAVHGCKNSEADFYFENLSDIPAILK